MAETAVATDTFLSRPYETRMNLPFLESITFLFFSPLSLSLFSTPSSRNLRFRGKRPSIKRDCQLRTTLFIMATCHAPARDTGVARPIKAALSIET